MSVPFSSKVQFSAGIECTTHPRHHTKLIGEEAETNQDGHASQRTLETVGEEFSDHSNDLLEEPSEPTMIPTSFWNFVCSFLFPLLVQSLFGGFYIVRTLFLGYALQYSSQLLSLTESTAIQVLGKSATPPPAFLGLALLTIAAFVIHPDGFTWIVLRKLRNGLIFMIESSSTCWTVAVNDYGTVVSSILALLTFFGLAFLVFIMHRTLSSKTHQHRARHPAADKQQRRKKRKHKSAKGRIRTNQTNAGGTRNDEEEPSDEQHSSTGEQTSNTLPPLVEDKPLLETIEVQSEIKVVVEDKPVLETIQVQPQTPAKHDSRHPYQRRDSFDSNFEDASSCETSVSSASVATPNRLPKHSTEQKDYTTVNNSKRRVKGASHSKSVGRGDLHRAAEKVPEKEKAPEIVASSRWDALKPASRSERYLPPQRTRHGRIEARNNRRGRKQNHKPHLASTITSADPPLFRSTPLTIQTAERKPAQPVNGYQQNHPIEMELNPESPPWNPSCVTATHVLAPPPGLDHIQSKEIPFGCGSSDGGNSAHRDFNATKEQEYPGEPSLFGAIGPSIPTVQQEADYTSSCAGTGEPFGTAAISYRSPVMPFTENPFEQNGSNDDDKIEAQLLELGGQMVGSILDF